MSITTIYTGKTINEQCLTCKHLSNLLFYCKHPLKDCKVRYSAKPHCKYCEPKEDYKHKEEAQ